MFKKKYKYVNMATILTGTYIYYTEYISALFYKKKIE